MGLFFNMANIKLEILQANYWEHFKFAKELGMYLTIDHPQRIKIEEELNKMQKELEQLKNDNIK